MFPGFLLETTNICYTFRMKADNQKLVADSYDKHADEYTRQYGYGEQLSISALKDFLSLLPKPAKILDVGCGGGQDSKFLSENGCDVLGIDISAEMIKLARKYSPKSNFILTDVHELPKATEYDGIWCSRVFHHISMDKQRAFLNKLNTLLKKGGILHITSAVSDKKADYEAFDAGEDKILKKRLTEESFKELLGSHNFEILGFKYWEGGGHMEIFAKKP